ncbi:hypothetical protein TNCV_4384871 [Trichonephila clavipes]|nr:hypothetical protein TNCV_4384871 [Trichonephila clavipes]
MTDTKPTSEKSAAVKKILEVEHLRSKLSALEAQLARVIVRPWNVEGIVSNVVEVSRTGLVSAGKGENNGPVVEESALLDEDDATEVHRLLDVAGAVSVIEIQMTM